MPVTDDHDTVSVVVIFLNEERFLAEAVESVYAQTYRNWELLLADDGSTDGSTDLARAYARRDPDHVRYVEHPGHASKGASAIRNLGVSAATGEWIAFLDGDDVWLPMRLERSVALAHEHPQADMVYGKTEYWHSWQGGDAGEQDRVQPHFFGADRLLRAPDLLIRHLSLRASFPCMGSLLVRRQAFLEVGGFEESFTELCTDLVFLGKFCLKYDVYVSNECWDRYRQHGGSTTAMASSAGQMGSANLRYLLWLRSYVAARGIANSSLDRALVGAIRRAELGPDAWRSRIGRAVRRVTRRAVGH
jgi:glycosyltransferase involved in cell wall biosynthesis